MNLLWIILLSCLAIQSKADVVDSYDVTDSYTVSNDDTYVFHDGRDDTYSSSHNGHNTSESESDPMVSFVFGWILFFISFPLLWFNEMRYCLTKDRIEKGFKICQVVQDPDNIDNSLDNQLVYVQGLTQTGKEVVDEEFNICLRDTLKIKRRVQILQWVENSKKQGEKTVVNYNLEWKDSVVSSASFRVKNQKYFNDSSLHIVQSKESCNDEVYLGARQLSLEQIQQVNKGIAYSPTDIQLAACKNLAQSHLFNDIQLDQTSIHMRQRAHEQTSGDLKISFEKVPCKELSIVAKQHNKQLLKYSLESKSQNDEEQLSEPGCCSLVCDLCRKVQSPLSEIDWVYEEKLTKKEIFQLKLSNNSYLNSAIRIGGWLLMTFGVSLIFSPVSIIINWLPYIGKYLSTVTGFIFGIISFGISTPISLIVIGLAWLFYRPIIGAILISVSFTILWAIKLHMEKNHGY